MKQQNFMVKFKNSFAKSPEFSQKNADILKDSLYNVTQQQMNSLLQLYRKDAFDNGYNPSFAFRLIILNCFTHSKTSFNMNEQVNRFINNQLNCNDLQGIQKCMDLIIFEQFRKSIQQKNFRFWRIKILQALVKYYRNNKEHKDKKKASYTMRQLCKQTLKRQQIKRDLEIYSKILDILLNEEEFLMKRHIEKNNNYQAAQNVNNMIRALQQTEQTILPKYQKQLMIAYWYLAQLHQRMHYIVYAKKYANIVLNIGQRIGGQKDMIQCAKQMLQRVVL